jgi:hypothetical protein
MGVDDEHRRRVFGVERRVIGEQSQQHDHGGRFGVVAIL